MRRSNNQDSQAVWLASNEQQLADRGHLFVVADGMGAHAAGELASQIATEQIVKEHTTGYSGGATQHDVGRSGARLRGAVEAANGAIHRRGQSNAEFHNMGTTASALVIHGGNAYIAHVGDSRIYRIRGGACEQLTFDHSLVWEMQASGQVHADSPLGKSIPKNVITRSLGPGPVVEVDSEGPLPIRIGDRFVLCSDGLTGPVSDEEIGALVAALPVDQSAEVLVDLANLRGGADNITVIVVQISDGPALHPVQPEGGPVKTSTRLPSSVLLATAAICWSAAAVMGTAAWLFDAPLRGSSIVAVVLGAIAIGFWAFNRAGSAGAKSSGATRTSGGAAPYRRYAAQPSLPLIDRLESTLTEIRTVADQSHWEVDWTEVDSMRRRLKKLASDGSLREAVVLGSEAILATMKQLRIAQNNSASETVIDL